MRLRLALIAGDVILSYLSVMISTYVRGFVLFGREVHDVEFLIPKAMVFSGAILISCFFMDLYNSEKVHGIKMVIARMLFAEALCAIIIGALYYFLPFLILWRGILMFSVFFSYILLTAWHISYVFILRLLGKGRRILVLGTGPIANNIWSIMKKNNNGYNLAGFINCMGEPINVPAEYVVSNGEGLLTTAVKQRAQKIVVSLGEKRGVLPIRELLDCKLRGIDVIDNPTFYEDITGKVMIEGISPSHIIFSDGYRITQTKRIAKRIVDISISILGLLISLPIFIIVPILIKLDSKGRVFFKQERVGEGEKIFNIYKFRTMYEDAEEKTGPVWSQMGDKRITRIGKFLRKWRIDELPQLYNVLKGDMSIVGPRPERPFFVETLKRQIPYYSERHYVKPGITGWAQVRYEYGDSVEDAIEKLRYDLYYIKNQSLIFDLLILLETIKVIITGRGGR